MRNLTRIKFALAVTAAWAGLPPTIASAADPEIEAIRREIRALEQRLAALEQKQAGATPAAASSTATAASTAAAAAAPKITITDRGYTLASGDAANSVRIRGLLQLDARAFSGDGGIVNDAFVLRRARLISEGQLARNFGYQILTEFGGSSVSILDASFTVGINRALQFKLGKYKTPVGHEQLQSDAFTFLNERSIVSSLVPNRDVGIQASGELFAGITNYQVGVFNGVADGGSSTNTDFDNSKEVAGRLMVSPFKTVAKSPLAGLQFGIAGTTGKTHTASGRTTGYRTDGQQTFFTYNSSVIADGETWRVSPQFDFRHGPFGAMGEYVVSASNLRPNATGAKAELKNRAWQLSAGYVFTGEDSALNGVVPRVDFDLAAGTWGAFEAVARYSRVKIDDLAFPTFASPGASADEARALGLGFNWYLSKAVVFKVDYYHTDFGLSALAPALLSNAVIRQDEQAFISRFQFNF